MTRTETTKASLLAVLFLQPTTNHAGWEKKKKVISKETTCKLETGGDIHMWLDGCGRSESG